MATQMEQIQQILLALLQKIPDAQHQALNDAREVATKDEVAKLNDEVKLLNEKFEEKHSTETVFSQVGSFKTDRIKAIIKVKQLVFIAERARRSKQGNIIDAET